jgi:protein-S-isoprenylcysteine O-methyltransferase Ste14
MTPQTALAVACITWLVSWIAAAFWSDRASARPGWDRETFYRALNVGGGIILFGDFAHGRWYGRTLWPVGNTLGWTLVAVAVIGFAFTWWARLHLGRLWSANVTRKADHHVVDTGPYALVRHPIYTGIILATIAIVIMRATVLAAVGACIMTLGWWIKARLEERFLREQLGKEQYDAYAARVPMLVPFTAFNTSRGNP